ncbi:hypothetical protein MUK42_35761 [Musa troglodytarum]|uniref:Uncharacterized protein n=1 Tax=Musa troglodytarum TaxID=320322 RepID=A0A9E7FBF3_9LILI|nr:hypothetical protein MUK42_35761 [Musa troglodytarum]
MVHGASKGMDAGRSKVRKDSSGQRDELQILFLFWDESSSVSTSKICSASLCWLVVSQRKRSCPVKEAAAFPDVLLKQRDAKPSNLSPSSAATALFPSLQQVLLHCPSLLPPAAC